MWRITVGLAVALVAVLSWRVANAHHSTIAFYDHSRWIALEGTVVEIFFVNPHVSLHLEVANEDGESEIWAVETRHRAGLQDEPEDDQWFGDTLQLGDRLIAIGNPGSRVETSMAGEGLMRPADGWRWRWSWVLENTSDALQKRYADFASPRSIASSNPAASQEVGATTDDRRHKFAGYWNRVSATARWWPSGEPGNPEGIPFTAEGLARHEPVNAGIGDEYLETYRPFRCEFYLGLIMTFGSVEIITRHDDDRVVLMYPTYENELRWVWVDGREYPRGALQAPRLMGYSIGQWEEADDGPELVVHTVGLETGYMRQEGIPYSDNAEIMERYTLSESRDRMYMEVTLNDPDYYTEPLSVVQEFERNEPPVDLYAECRLDVEAHRIGGQTSLD